MQAANSFKKVASQVRLLIQGVNFWDSSQQYETHDKHYNEASWFPFCTILYRITVGMLGLLHHVMGSLANSNIRHTAQQQPQKYS